MKRFTGIAAITIAAFSGFAWAQPTIVGPPDEMPRNRTERPGASELAPRAPEGSGRDAQRPEEPSRERRGAQSEEFRSRDPQQLQKRDREPGQRERPTGPSEQRAHPRMQQVPEQGQAQRSDERKERRERDQARPNERNLRSPETAQPQRPGDRSNAPDTAQPAPSQQNGERPGATAQRPSPAQPGTQPAENRKAPANARTESDNQRIADTVRDRVERREIRPEQNLGASVTVGARLPSRVQLRPLPRDIAAIRPQYRDYHFTVSDREIMIVDPHDRRIVEVIDRNGGGGGTGDIYAAFEHRRDVRRWNRPTTVAFQVGVVLPANAPYYDLPIEVVERNPQWRGYQYVMTESEEVAIVEPRSHRIVNVVDKDTSRTASAAPAPAGAALSQPQQAASDDRHELARMILTRAKPGEIQGADGLRGAVLSSETRLQPLPAEVEERDQQLRGYHYTLIGDDVLIVDPQSRRVVDVIE